MRLWVRALRDRRCGACRGPIRVGDPMLKITIATVTEAMVRCKTCAGEDVPADLPERQAIAPIDPHAFARFGVLPLDFSRQAREPGEEG